MWHERILRVLFGAALVLGLSAAFLAFGPVSNPGVQDCGAPLLFVLTGADNDLIHPVGPVEEAAARQPTCRQRSVDALGRASWLFAVSVLCAGAGAAVGLAQDRARYRHAPRFESLLRELPDETRARHGLVARVTPDDLGPRLPPEEPPEVAGMMVVELVATVTVVLLASPAALARAFTGSVVPVIVASAAVLATPLIAAELRTRLFLIEPGRAGWLAVMIAAGWLVPLRPLVGSAGVDLHVLRRYGRRRDEARAGAEAVLAVSVCAGAVLAGAALVAAWATPIPRSGAGAASASELVVVGAVVVLVIAGLWGARARWRGLPVHPSWRSVRDLDRLAHDGRTTVAVVLLALARPVLLSVVVACCLALFGVPVPLAGVLLVASAVPVAVAVSPTPAGAGTVEAVTVLGLLAVTGAEVAPAAGAALAFRVLTFWLPMVPGAVATRRLRDAGVLMVTPAYAADALRSRRKASSSSSLARRR